MTKRKRHDYMGQSVDDIVTLGLQLQAERRLSDRLARQLNEEHPPTDTAIAKFCPSCQAIAAYRRFRKLAGRK